MTTVSCESTVSISSPRLGSGCVILASLLIGAPGGPSAPPARLAIFYGYPTLVNGASGDVARAAAEFARYDVLVFGDGLQLPRPDSAAADGAEHRRSREMIGRLRRAARPPEILGYVALGDTQQLAPDEVVRRIGAWRVMGADGVFLDEAGYDFGVTRDRQNAAVRAAHARGMWACLNAFRLSDVFDSGPSAPTGRSGGNPRGVAPGLTGRDAILLESFAVANGRPEPLEDLKARVRTALDGRQRFGTRIFAVATAATTRDTTLANYGWWMAALFGLDAFGWAAPDYSALDSALPSFDPPIADRAALLGAGPLGGVVFEGTRWTRLTTAGRIVVDTAAKTGELQPR